VIYQPAEAFELVAAHGAFERRWLGQRRRGQHHDGQRGGVDLRLELGLGHRRFGLLGHLM
jgi:hypothetical protein